MANGWIETLAAAGLESLLRPCGAGQLLTCTRGARAFPLDETGAPLLWVAPTLLRPPAAGLASLPPSFWNMGGERLWIAPEIRFMIRDRGDFDGSYELPAAMDPGRWAADPDEPDRYLQSLELEERDTGELLRLEVEQRLAEAADPLRRSHGRTAVRHMGWTREVRLRRSQADAGTVACQSWVVVQVPPGGHAWVPGAAGARVTDYFEPVDGAHLQRPGGHAVLNLTGRRRYKVGLRTGEHRGLLLHWREVEGGRAVLTLRRFHDLPSTRYLEQPPAAPRHEGDSAYVYNDDGRHGGFGELEVLGHALEPAARSVADLFEMHVWWGPAADVAAVARAWLGAEWAPALTTWGEDPKGGRAAGDMGDQGNQSA